MFLRFFLNPQTYNKNSSRYNGQSYSSSTVGHEYTASSHRPDVKQYEEKTTIVREISNILTHVCVRSAYTSLFCDKRVVLINVPDVVMLELEIDGVYEYSYCTYNFSSDNIGFGSSAYSANHAAAYIPSPNIGFGFGVGSVFATTAPKEKMIDFFIKTENRYNIDNSFEYLVKEPFYDQILDELIPYIEFEKLQIFTSCANNIAQKGKELSDVIREFKTYYEEKRTNEIPKILDEELDNVLMAVLMFLEDDIVIQKHKESLVHEIEAIRAFVVTINEELSKDVLQFF